MATPGHGGPLRRLAEELLPAERLPHGVDVDRDRGLGLRRGDLRRRLAEDRPELTLELANARLARVLGDDRLERVVGDRDLVLAQAVRARAAAATGSRVAIAAFSSVV